MRCTSGKPPAGAQQGLKESLVQQDYFLACVAKPETDMAVALPDSDHTHVAAVVSELERLSADVLRIRLICEGDFAYRGGQFLNLVRHDGLIRPYSIASLPDRDGFLELHVRRTREGNMSRWLHEELAVGQRLHVRGPAGDCFYLAGSPEQPLLLVGTGTGLAPLYAIVQDALRAGHQGRILLFHGALREDGFYLVDELNELSAVHDNFSYRRCMPEGEPAASIEIGEIDRLVLDAVGRPAPWRSYLCGHPGLINDLRKKLFLAGASLKQIHSDAFVTAAR